MPEPTLAPVSALEGNSSHSSASSLPGIVIRETHSVLCSLPSLLLYSSCRLLLLLWRRLLPHLPCVMLRIKILTSEKWIASLFTEVSHCDKHSLDLFLPRLQFQKSSWCCSSQILEVKSAEGEPVTLGNRWSREINRKRAIASLRHEGRETDCAGEHNETRDQDPGQESGC